jgi:hypothetical protein
MPTQINTRRKESKLDPFEKILEKLDVLKSADEAFDLMVELFCLYEATDENIFYGPGNSDLFEVAIREIFGSKFFISNLREAIPRNKWGVILREFSDKQVKRLASSQEIALSSLINLAGFFLALHFRNLSDDRIMEARKNIERALRSIEFQEDGVFSLGDICTTLYQITADRDFNYTKKFQTTIGDLDLFLELHKTSRILMEEIFLFIPQITLISKKFSFAEKALSSNALPSIVLPRQLGEICDLAGKFKNKIEQIKNYGHSFIKETELFDNFLENLRDVNERVISFMVEEITSYTPLKEKYTYMDLGKLALSKIHLASQMQEKIHVFAKTNLTAFNAIISEQDFEWSNKAYIVTSKAISGLSSVEDAYDKRWKTEIFSREMQNWIIEMHKILNKYDIEDDWAKIANQVRFEDKLVEWKSSFFTPTEDLPKEPEALVALSEKVFNDIIRNIVGMMNGDGGAILVGLIENRARVRAELADKIIEKNGISFFNVGWELEVHKRNFDDLRRFIQDKIKTQTRCSIEQFDSYWNLEPITIRAEAGVFQIYRINVKPINSPIFFIDLKSSETIWVSFVKRVNGRTMNVDPRTVLRDGSMS